MDGHIRAEGERGTGMVRRNLGVDPGHGQRRNVDVTPRSGSDGR